VAEFIERYYNAQRLHSALSYQSPDRFEQSIEPEAHLPGVKMSFFRHGEIFQSDGGNASRKKPPKDGFPAHRSDESPTGYSSPGWSPPEPDSALPVTVILKHGNTFGKKK